MWLRSRLITTCFPPFSWTVFTHIIRILSHISYYFKLKPFIWLRLINNNWKLIPKLLTCLLQLLCLVVCFWLLFINIIFNSARLLLVLFVCANAQSGPLGFLRLIIIWGSSSPSCCFLLWFFDGCSSLRSTSESTPLNELFSSDIFSRIPSFRLLMVAILLACSLLSQKNV